MTVLTPEICVTKHWKKNISYMDTEGNEEQTDYALTYTCNLWANQETYCASSNNYLCKQQDLNTFLKMMMRIYQNMIIFSLCEIKWFYGGIDYKACRHSHFIHSNMTIICDDGFDVKYVLAWQYSVLGTFCRK